MEDILPGQKAVVAGSKSKPDGDLLIFLLIRLRQYLKLFTQ